MDGDNPSDLLDRVYAAAWDPGALDEALRGIAHACRSRSAGLFRLCDGGLAWEQSYNMPDDFMGDFVANAAPHDPRVVEALRQPSLTLMRDDDPRMRRAMCESGIDDFTRRYDLPYTLSSVLNQSAPTDALALYVSRGVDDGAPDARQVATFTRLAPHFARAMALRRRIRADLLTDARVLTTAGTPKLGVLALDRHRRVRWLDGSAEQLLRSSDGIGLLGARLRFDDAAAARYFEHLADGMDGRRRRGHDDVLRIVQAPPAGMLTLRLLPNPLPLHDNRAPVLVLLRRHAANIGQPLAPAMPIPTPRQGEVLALLALGLMSKQISTTLDISENTVRNHVHALLQMFEAPTRTACVARAREYGLVD